MVDGRRPGVPNERAPAGPEPTVEREDRANGQSFDQELPCRETFQGPLDDRRYYCDNSGQYESWPEHVLGDVFIHTCFICNAGGLRHVDRI